MKSLKLAIRSSILLLSLFLVKAEPAQAGLTFSGFIQFIGNFSLVSVVHPCDASIVCGSSCEYSGVVYNTVQIGTQCWMGKNINVGAKLASGSTMPSDPFDYNNIEKWCYNNDVSLCKAEGGLYTWAEAMGLASSCNTTDCSGQITYPRQGICPTGWHIPRDDGTVNSTNEWYTLENYLKITGQTCNAARSGAGDCNDAGTDMKSSGSPYFYAPLAGYRAVTGTFSNRTSYAILWSSSQSDATRAWYRYLDSSVATVNRYSVSKVNGFSVRCLKD